MHLILILLFLLVSFYGLSRLFSLSPTRTPLLFFALLSCVLFLGGMTGLLKASAFLMILTLSSLGLFALTRDLYHRTLDRSMLMIFSLFILISMGLFLYTLHMTLSVIDEHVYWAMMSKTLYLTDAWPTESSTMLKRHLRYTPGTSLIHYFFFQMFQQYDESIAYFAQALMIASCAFALIQLRALQKTSAMACLLLVILHLQYGSVLARLDVDALLSMVMVAWLVGQLDEQKPSSLITSLLILLFLSLIKEIGLYFAMTLLLLEIKLKHDRDTLLKALCITLIISLFHGLWSHYCNTQEFPRFASLRAWPLILQDFNPFHAASHPAQLIFIRDLVEAPIDRLNTPGIVWFGLIASMIYRFFKKDLDLSLIETSPALARQSLLGLCVIFGTYLLLLYELQVSTFHLGELHQGVRVDQVVTARRYFNLGFSPIVLFSFYMILAHYFKQRSSLHFYLRIFALSAAFIAYSYHHRLSVDDEYALGKSVSTALHAQELVAKGSHLCVAHEATTTGEAFAKKERFVLQLRHYLLDLNIAVAIEHPLHPCHYRIKMTDKNWTLQALSDEKDAHEP